MLYQLSLDKANILCTTYRSIPTCFVMFAFSQFLLYFNLDLNQNWWTCLCILDLTTPHYKISFLVPLHQLRVVKHQSKNVYFDNPVSQYFLISATFQLRFQPKLVKILMDTWLNTPYFKISSWVMLQLHQLYFGLSKQNHIFFNFNQQPKQE